MLLHARTHLSFPRELVFRTYRDSLVKVVPYLPNVRSIEVRERHEEGGRVHLVNIWTAATEIPPVAQRFVPASLLSWTDYAEWDEAAWTCRWKLDTHAFPGFLECTGTTTFLPDDDSRTEVRVDGVLVLHLEKAHIPRLLAGKVGPMFEKVVVTGLKPNLLSTGEGVERYLLAQRGR